MAGRPTTSGGAARKRARTTVAVLAAITCMISAGPVAQAAPKPTKKELRRQLTALQKDADRLIEDYNATLDALTKARRTEQTARGTLGRSQAAYDAVRQSVSRYASMRYQGYADPGIAMLTGSDPRLLLGRLAVADQLAAEQEARLQRVGSLRDTYALARASAERRADELGRTAEELSGKREKAEALIEKIKDRIDLLVTPSSRKANGMWVPELPSGADNITPRMRIVRDLIQERFAMPFGVGCYRSANDGGQHPLGRACDFMVSSGGAMPTSANARLGAEISAWAIKNAARLGIMYVIYRQRIWHASTGVWRPMSNRGGVTANHYDHPHISVY